MIEKVFRFVLDDEVGGLEAVEEEDAGGVIQYQLISRLGLAFTAQTNDQQTKK